jgi:alpha-maltose-1-phosphate synthase
VARPQIIGVICGDPFDRATWSGASHHLFSALQRRGVLAGVVDSRPPAAIDLAVKALSVWPRRRRWAERYEFGTLHRAALSWFGARRARELNVRADVLLQIGAYFDFVRFSRSPSPRIRCSYHDSNLELFRTLWTYFEDPEASHVQNELRNERRTLDALDLVMTMSEWLRQSFLRDFGQRPDKVVTVGTGANLTHLPRPPLDREAVPPRLLFVGLEWERKGGPQLLAAFRRLRADRSDVELFAVGQERPVGTAEPGVHWLGRIDRRTADGNAEFDRLQREATVFVLPSIYDPAPNAVLEAMTYALPCVATRVCAIPEIVEDGVSGLLVEPRDVDALYVALRALVADPARARAMGEIGRRTVLERFTWDAVADRMVGAIDARLAA